MISKRSTASALATRLRCASLVASLRLARLIERCTRARDRLATVAQSAPPFYLTTPAGTQVTLRSYAGRPLVLNVFASWCPPCRSELPRIAAAARRTKPRVAFFGVDEQEAERIATAYAKSMHLPYPIAIDNGQFAASYGARSLPETIFIDSRGVVRAIVRGTISQAVLDRDLAML